MHIHSEKNHLSNVLSVSLSVSVCSPLFVSSVLVRLIISFPVRPGPLCFAQDSSRVLVTLFDVPKDPS